MDCFKEEFEDTKGVIRIRKAKKDRQHNGQNKKDKQRSTKHTHKSKDRVTRKPLKTEGLVVSVRFRIFNLLENNVVSRRKQQCMLSTAIIRQRKSINPFCTLQL
jgi:hypothetical protein